MMRGVVRSVCSLVCALVCGFSLGGCREWETPSFEHREALPNVTLGDLRTYLAAEAEMTFRDSIVVAGRVVSSDREGNFYNTFFIDDGTGAAEIMAGMADLDAVYHPGQRVSVSLRGLAVGWRDGAMQIGLPPEPGNRFATGYFYHRAVIRRYVAAERSVENVEPLEVKLGELSQELCGRLVRIAGVKADDGAFANGPAGDANGGSAGDGSAGDAGLDGDATWAVARPSPRTGYVKFRSVVPTDLTEASAPADLSEANVLAVLNKAAVPAAAPVPFVPPKPHGLPVLPVLPAPTVVPASSVLSASNVPPVPPRGDSITVVTSGYASWASDRVPRGEVSLTGILLYGRGEGGREHFLLKPRDETDIAVYF